MRMQKKRGKKEMIRGRTLGKKAIKESEMLRNEKLKMLKSKTQRSRKERKQGRQEVPGR